MDPNASTMAVSVFDGIHNTTVSLFSGNISENATSTSSLMRPDNSDFKPIEEYWQFQWCTNLMVYLTPIIVLGGTIGNMLAFAVLQTPAFRKNPSSLVISALALVDTGVLVTAALRSWMLFKFDEDVRAMSDASCRAHYFFTYLLRHLSCGYLMLLTIERTVSVTFPFKCKELCSRKRMMLAVLAMTLFTAAINAHAFGTMRVRPDFYSGELACQYIPSSESFHRGAWYWMDSSLASFIPFGVIFFCNVIIITKIMASQRMRAEKASTKDGGRITSTTVMLLAISISFLILTLPACIYFIGLGNNTWPQKTMYDYANISLVYAVVNNLYYVNSAINFVMYCLTGTKFRRELLNIFCRRCRKRPQASSTSNHPVTISANVDSVSKTQATSTTGI